MYIVSLTLEAQFTVGHLVFVYTEILSVSSQQYHPERTMKYDCGSSISNIDQFRTNSTASDHQSNVDYFAKYQPQAGELAQFHFCREWKDNDSCTLPRIFLHIADETGQMDYYKNLNSNQTFDIESFQLYC
jgi:hypothetical protein